MEYMIRCHVCHKKIELLHGSIYQFLKSGRLLDFHDLFISFSWSPWWCPCMTDCLQYSRHKAFLRFCLSEHGICRISRSCADISMHSEHTPSVLLLLMIQYLVLSYRISFTCRVPPVRLSNKMLPRILSCQKFHLS